MAVFDSLGVLIELLIEGTRLVIELAAVAWRRRRRRLEEPGEA